MEHKNAIAVSNVSKSFSRGVRAVSEASFSVHAGERVALLGASGSGKSTLLRMIAGLERSDVGVGKIQVCDGAIQANGEIAADIRNQRRNVSIVFQQFNLVGRLSVLTNVLMGLAPKLSVMQTLLGRFSLVERAHALDALDAVGLRAVAFQRASTLSGGQQQRAAIARALVQGAKVVLADEPIASLDPASAERVMEQLVQLNEKYDVTVLASLHNVDVARRFFARVIAMRNGFIVYDGPTTALTNVFLRDLYQSSSASSDTEREQLEATQLGAVPAWARAPGSQLASV